MKKSLLIIPLLLSAIIIGCSSGSSESSTIKTSTQTNINKSDKTCESQTSTASDSNGVVSSTKIEYEYIKNLKVLEVENLNVSNNAKTDLVLPNGWHGNKAIYKNADSFQFNEQKNKDIKKLYSYEIFDDKNLTRGTLEFIGNSNMPIGEGLNNHCVQEKIIYNGVTKLGNGVIYLLRCDLPKEQITDKYNSYQQIYSIISIKNEVLAYNISINVPLGEKEDKYIEIMKKMLIENYK